MDFKKLLLLTFLPVIAGCSSAQPTQDDVQTQNANIQLAQASTTVSHSLTELTGLTRAVTPPLAIKNLPNPDSYNMDSLASIDWDGPVGPVVEKIALATHYQLRILGQPPAIPVLISLNEKNMPLGYILRNIDFQSGHRANIVVFPERRVIELRYGRS